MVKMRVSSKEEALEIIKKEMRKDKKELGTFVRTGDTEWRLSK